ncbi:hypothetical protein [Cupriavidus sp. AU9028]|uniref:hypothetical protein n=1 Tax=Cupriavidus sp. AU9028 TaxID=2871157 RepID=UPI001C95CCE8|nr:hypothetical protein [Cupriavidus sp. AU9028]MBY4897114.1 hypothetical protein [Cupriavidus sp. AU9028]
MYERPTSREVIAALRQIADIPRPAGDNEGDPINSEPVFAALSREHQARVERAEQLCRAYARDASGEPDRRALNTLSRHGFQAHLGPAQYDPDRLVGSVTSGEWDLVISDPRTDDDGD